MRPPTEDDFLTDLTWALTSNPSTHNNQSGALLIGDTPETVNASYNYIKTLIPSINEKFTSQNNFPIQKICDVEVPSKPKIRQMILSFIDQEIIIGKFKGKTRDTGDLYQAFKDYLNTNYDLIILRNLENINDLTPKFIGHLFSYLRELLCPEEYSRKEMTTILGLFFGTQDFMKAIDRTVKANKNGKYPNLSTNLGRFRREYHHIDLNEFVKVFDLL